MNRNRVWIGGALALLVSACSTSGTRPDPIPAKVISLDEAIHQVQASISKARQAPPAEKAGLLPSKATVTFVMAAEAGQDNQNSAKIGVALPVGLSFEAGGQSTETSKASTSNTIVIEFENPLLAPGDSILGKVAEEGKWKKLDELDKALEGKEAITPP
jgi:hypothetical protein